MSVVPDRAYQNIQSHKKVETKDSIKYEGSLINEEDKMKWPEI